LQHELEDEKALRRTAEAAAQHATETNRQLMGERHDIGVLRQYTREVSTFYRENLKPLIAYAKRAIEQPQALAAPDKDVIKKVLNVIETRAKFYDDNAVVEKTNEAGKAELARLTVKHVP
jgi:hypothetical protein